MTCYLCGDAEYFKRPGQVRDDPLLDVLECSGCGLVYLSSVDHISDELYQNSGMHTNGKLDIEAWLEETKHDDSRRYQFLQDRITDRKVLDFGCGAGGFLDLARMNAESVVGVELERAARASYTARGLTVYSHLNQVKESDQRWDFITAFHVIEHLRDPRETLKKLSSLLNEGGEIVIEVPSSDDALLTLYGNVPFQNFTYWDQHLFLFNPTTIKKLIEQVGLSINWLKHVQRYPLSNHLYWLAKGYPGGHEEWAFMNNEVLDAQYEQQLAALGLTDTIIASLSLCKLG